MYSFSKIQKFLLLDIWNRNTFPCQYFSDTAFLLKHIVRVHLDNVSHVSAVYSLQNNHHKITMAHDQTGNAHFTRIASCWEFLLVVQRILHYFSILYHTRRWLCNQKTSQLLCYSAKVILLHNALLEVTYYNCK